MDKLSKLEQIVHDLYDSKDKNRADWSDWLAKDHVFVVADYAERLALKHGASVTLSRAAAVLHDIADYKMSRFDQGHEQASLDIARDLLHESGFRESEISLVVDDAIRYHSCHDGESPNTVEGKILATADSLAHLQTDFYFFAAWSFGKDGTLFDYRNWASEKLERDFHDKILFDDVKTECERKYLSLKQLINS